MDSPTIETPDVRENLLARLDRLPLTRSTKILFSLVIIAWVVEALSIGIIGTIVLSLREALDLSPSQVGLLGVASTVGIAVGLPLSGWMTDRWGRRNVLIAGVAVFGVATLLGAAVEDVWYIAFMRFIGGIGEGAVFPIPYLMLAEIVSPRRRATITGYANTLAAEFGYISVSALGGFALATFTVDVAYRIPFLVAGGITLLFLIPVVIWLPESPRYLLGVNRVDEARMYIEKLEDEAGVAHDETVRNDMIRRHLNDPNRRPSLVENLKTLVSSAYLKRGVVTGLAYMATYFVWYTHITYSSTLLTQEGFSKSGATYLVGAVFLIGVGGGISQGHLADRFGRKPVYTTYITGAVLGVILVGVHPNRAVLFAGLALIGWFAAGIFGVAKIVLAEQYPTEIRGLGASILEMFGRTIPGVGFVFAVPYILEQSNVTTVWLIVATLTVLCYVPFAIWGRETANVTLEEVGAPSPASEPRRRRSNVTAER